MPPQTWDEKGNLVQSKAPPGMPPIMPGSAAANPNAPAIMPPTTAKKPKMTWDEKGKPIQGGQAATSGPGPGPVHKDRPFTAGAYDAFGLDPEKIVPMTDKGVIGTIKGTGEAIKETGVNLGKWIVSASNDPLRIADPATAVGGNLKDSFKEVHEGLTKGDHNKLMHGLGLATGTLGPILAEKMPGMAKGAAFGARDLASKRAIISAASHGALDTLKDDHSAAFDTAVKAEHARIGGDVQAINIADEARNPGGYKPTTDVATKLNDSITAKKASVMLKEGKLPKTSQIKSLIAGHGPNLTFNDIKYIRTTAEGLLRKAEGVDKAILSENIKYLTSEAESRARSLGKIQEWESFNEASRNLGKHTNAKGLIPDLQNSKTGLDYYKKIVSESNKPNLDELLKDLHMPSDFFDKATKGPVSKMAYFAKLSEGDSFQAKLTNRLIAMRKHPIISSAGGMIGLEAGKAIGQALGFPMMGPFIGFTFGAGLAHDLISKYDAAKAIREIGGPSGVMGARQATPPTGQAAPPGGPQGGSPFVGGNPKMPNMGGPTGQVNTGPSNGPGGGGSPSPTQPPVSTPPVSPPSAPVEATRATPEAPKAAEKTPVEQVDRRDHLKRPVYNLMRQARIDELRKIMKDARKPGGDILEYAKAASMLADFLKHPEEAKDAPLPSIEDMKRGGKPEKTMTREEAEAASAKRHEPQVTKAEPEARGRTESARKGMTKDSPEARKAKNAAAKAAKRASGEYATQSSGGDVVSKAEAMKKPGEKITTGGVEDIPLLEGKLAELFPKVGGKKFVAKFRRALDDSYGKDYTENNPEHYKTYLLEAIEKKMAADAPHEALESQIPGLKKD